MTPTEGTELVKQEEEENELKPFTGSTHVFAEPSVVLSYRHVPGSQETHPKIHSYRIRPARLDEDYKEEDEKENIVPNKRRRM
jgi:hypothetical protein